MPSKDTDLFTMIQKLLKDLKDGCFGMRSSDLILLVKNLREKFTTTTTTTAITTTQLAKEIIIEHEVA